MKKALLFILTLAMLLTLPLTAFAAQGEAVNVEATEAALKESANLAYGAGVYANWSEHEGSGFNKDLITDGTLNGNYAGAHGMAWHSGNSQDFSRPTWIAIDFGKEVTIDNVVIYPRSDGSTFSAMPNAFSLVVSDSNLDADGNVWIGEGCSYAEPNRISYMPTGTTIYEQYAIEKTVDGSKPVVCQFEAVTTQYLVFYSLSQYGPWRSTELCEIAAYNNGYTPVSDNSNIALGKPVTASSSHEGGPWSSANLTDGDRYNFNYDLSNRNDHGQYTGYHSGLDTASGETVTLDIDLGAASTFDSITLWPSTCKYSTTETDTVSTNFPSNYTIQVSDDGASWETVVTVTAGISEYAPVTHTLAEAVTAQYVRMAIVKGENHIQIAELEITSTTKTPDTPAEPETLTSGDKLFAVNYQTRDAAEGYHDMRIVIVANEEKLSEISSTATVTVTFVLESGAELYLENTLGGAKSDYGLYRKVTASGDVYTAAEGYCLFGNVVTNIPNGAYTSVSVTIVDNTTNTTLVSVTSN